MSAEKDRTQSRQINGVICKWLLCFDPNFTREALGKSALFITTERRFRPGKIRDCPYLLCVLAVAAAFLLPRIISICFTENYICRMCPVISLYFNSLNYYANRGRKWILKCFVSCLLIYKTKTNVKTLFCDLALEAKPKLKEEFDGVKSDWQSHVRVQEKRTWIFVGQLC